MMRSLFLSLALVLVAFPAAAQPIESEPLAAPNYTLKNETDPMALTPPPSGIPPSKTIIAPPPPADTSQDIPARDQPINLQDKRSQPLSQDYPVAAPKPLPAYNSNVSGVPPVDPSRYINKTFCTLKVSFDSTGKVKDRALGDAVKTYLESSADKLTYIDSQKGRAGEYSYCLTIREHRHQAQIYKDLKKIIQDAPRTNQTAILFGRGFTPVRTLQQDYQD